MKEKLAIWMAWHLPRSLVYWCAVRVGAAPSLYGDQVVPELTVRDALKRWGTP